MVSWSTAIEKDHNNEGMFHFINKVMARAYCLVFDSIPPNIFLDLRKLLQLNPNTRDEDLYMFENHTMLRIYGFEEDPYMLPTFLSPRIYALKDIR